MKEDDKNELNARLRQIIKIIQDDVYTHHILPFDKSVMVQVSKKIDNTKDTLNSIDDDSVLFVLRDFIYKIYHNDDCDKPTLKQRQKSFDNITAILFHKQTYRVIKGQGYNKKFYDKIHTDKPFMIINKEILFVLMRNNKVQKSFVDVLIQIVINISSFKRCSYFFKMEKMIENTGYSRKQIINVLKELSSRNIIAISNNNQYGEGVITLNPDFYENPSKYINTD
ncbi:MAG: hypothetical protein KQH59_01945 [Desulfobulbaceae bacterium]|nr:hypothetical protein [Desulfobulbaceae bacterium]